MMEKPGETKDSQVCLRNWEIYNTRDDREALGNLRYPGTIRKRTSLEQNISLDYEYKAVNAYFNVPNEMNKIVIYVTITRNSMMFNQIITKTKPPQNVHHITVPHIQKLGQLARKSLKRNYNAH
ncbi:hypothetical protein SK128_025473 [Halocaridina rubra]|uniref:Uncharacterized protein n=1 Tax=Halocaridina rubra TaxID=373956 RepID=A0AAN9A3I4_HALRR